MHTRNLQAGDRVRFISPEFPQFLGKQGIVIRVSISDLPAVIVQIDGDRRWVHGDGVLERVSEPAQA